MLYAESTRPTLDECLQHCMTIERTTAYLVSCWHALHATSAGLRCADRCNLASWNAATVRRPALSRRCYTGWMGERHNRHVYEDHVILYAVELLPRVMNIEGASCS